MITSTHESGESVPPDVVLSAVANDHRRAILRALTHTDEETMEVNELTEHVAEHLRDGEPPDDDHRQRVRIALHHIHLPKLEACGMVSHDTETDRVRNATGELSRELLTVVESYEERE